MPVNSFDDYPMSWRPNKEDLAKPYYITIADALESDIRTGNLAPGVQLPPQRELADFLDLHLSTITRAYKVCELKGLIYAIVGKGSFVSLNLVDLPNAINNQQTRSQIDMRNINPFPHLDRMIVEAANKVLERASVMHLLDYTKPWLNQRHLDTAKYWLAQANLDVSTENMLITSGSQNALSIALLSLFEPGDRIVVDRYTYPNFISLAKRLHLRLVPIESDDNGMQPDFLEKGCKLNPIKGIYLMPSCNNPTGISISPSRKKELASIIVKNNLTLIEDEAYSFLALPSDLPFASIIPENTIYISGISKSISPGLRVAFMSFPEKLRQILISGAFDLNLSTPALNNEIITELILEGEAEEIVQRKITLTQERNSLYQQILYPVKYNPMSFFQWFELPEYMDSIALEKKAQTMGVSVLCARHFCIGAVKQNYLRIATCSPKTSDQLNIVVHLSRQITEHFLMNMWAVWSSDAGTAV